METPTVRAIEDYYFLDDDSSTGRPRRRGMRAFTVDRDDAELFPQNGSFRAGEDEYQVISVEDLDDALSIVRANRRRPATP